MLLRIRYFILLFSIILLGCSFQPNDTTTIEVIFSPNGGITDSIVKQIAEAKKSIKIQAFSCTSPAIGDAIVLAHHKGIKIEVILDRENLGNPNSLLRLFFEKGITIFIDDKHHIAHNKIIIIDDSVVITGSANFSRSAEEKNAENSLIIKDRKLTARYISNWALHKKHSYRYGN